MTLAGLAQGTSGPVSRGLRGCAGWRPTREFGFVGLAVPLDTAARVIYRMIRSINTDNKSPGRTSRPGWILSRELVLGVVYLRLLERAGVVDVAGF